MGRDPRQSRRQRQETGAHSVLGGAGRSFPYGTDPRPRCAPARRGLVAPLTGAERALARGYRRPAWGAGNVRGRTGDLRLAPDSGDRRSVALRRRHRTRQSLARRRRTREPAGYGCAAAGLAALRTRPSEVPAGPPEVSNLRRRLGTATTCAGGILRYGSRDPGSARSRRVHAAPARSRVSPQNTGPIRRLARDHASFRRPELCRTGIDRSLGNAGPLGRTRGARTRACRVETFLNAGQPS